MIPLSVNNTITFVNFGLKLRLFSKVLFGCLCALQISYPGNILAFDVNPVINMPNIDGSLNEWGGIGTIELNPSDKGVGLRGAFNGLPDHWAAILLSWDSDSLYAAVTVVDNVCDTHRIKAGENVWKGPNGEKEDMMFYFDHFKLFLRDPNKPLGFNLWVKPNCDDSGIYFWGGQQRGTMTDELPLRVASKAKDETYSYELAIPWSWLRIEPYSNMTLKSLFLLSDADTPDLIMRKKVRDGSKWIWWEGELTMRGHPSGLPEEEVQYLVSSEVSDVDIETESPPNMKIVGSATQRKTEPIFFDDSKDDNDYKNDEKLVSDLFIENVEVDSFDHELLQSTDGRVSVSQLRMQLQRNLLTRNNYGPAPEWIYEKAEETTLRRSQIDTLYYRLRENLQRIIKENINSRSDGIITDLADYTGIWRSEARGFVLILLDEVLEDLRIKNGRMQPILKEWAISHEIEIVKLEKFIEVICIDTEKAYINGKILVSSDLVNKARIKSGLSERQMRQLISLIADRL